MADSLEVIKLKRVERLEEIRRSLGKNQAEFAKIVGIEPGSYSDIKRMKVGISSNLLRILEKNIGVNPEWILSGTGNKWINEKPELNVQEEKISGNTDSNLLSKLIDMIDKKDKQIEAQQKTLQELSEKIGMLMPALQYLQEAGIDYEKAIKGKQENETGGK